MPEGDGPEAATEAEAERLYGRYGDILDALERCDYSDAIDRIQYGGQGDENAREIVITPENFWDWFEYREDFKKRVNDRGGIETDYTGIECGLVLKDEVRGSLAAGRYEEIAVSFDAVYLFEKAKIDAANGTFVWTGDTDGGTERSGDCRIPTSPWDVAPVGAGEEWIPAGSGDVYYERLLNIGITRAEGTLRLKDTDGTEQPASATEAAADGPAREAVPGEAARLTGKYGDILALLEKNDTSGAVSLILEMQSEGVGLKEVVITPENFWDYFEYREDFMKRYNAFGEIETNESYIVCGLALKEEVRERVDASKSSAEIAVAFEAVFQYETAEIDTENGTFVWTGDADIGSIRRMQSSCLIACGPRAVDLYGAGGAYEAGNVKYYQRMRSIKITSTEGSLWLRPEG